MGITFKLKRGYQAEWVSLNPVLKAGEPGFEIDTSRYKIGNGASRWTELPYFLNEDDVNTIIQNGGGSSTPVTELIAEHINSATPHPAYDDIPSLVLLYENAKV